MLLTLVRKEIKEMLTRSIIMYMVAMSVIFALVGRTISSSQQGAAGKAILAVENHDSGNYSTTLIETLKSGAQVVYNGDDASSARQALEEKNGVVLLVIPSDFSQQITSGQQAEIQTHWLMRGTGFVDAMPQGLIEGLVGQARSAISAELIAANTGLNPAIVLDPMKSADVTEYKGKMVAGMTPSQISAVLSTRTMVIPIAVMMLIIMGASSVISSMGMEKENRTLETLLTLPVRRRDIIVAKIGGSAVVGLILGAIYMAGFATYFSSLGVSSSSLAQLGLSLGIVDYLLIALSVFVALLSGLCLSIILGTFASGYRQAQTLTFPIIGLAMLPMMLTLFQDFDTMSLGMKILVFAIPFSHPMMAMKALMLDNYGLVLAGIGYCLLVTAIMVGIAVWIFSTDRVVTGMMSRKKSMK